NLNPIHETVNPVGVSTYLALTFGTLLSSQGTDASFVLTLSGFPPGFPSVLAVLLSCVSDSIRTFRRLIPSQRDRFKLSAFAFPFRRVHYVNRFPGRLIIEPRSSNFGMPK
ncbi:hypothetical protein ACFV85_37430, partial [Streptomyces niveus]|uniref:hypothetical protein n=1 Tax=Streptomyces niveus TaxID=193462 RepID=UPI003646BA68